MKSELFTLKDSRIVVWDINVGNVILTLTGHNGGVTGIQLNGSIAASASYDGTIRLWDIGTRSVIQTYGEQKSRRKDGGNIVQDS